MYKRQKGRQHALSLLLISCLMLAVLPASAQEAMDPVGFSVQAVLPDNQRDSASYFDLLMEPSEEQVLYIEVNNHMNIPLRVRIDMVDAYSNANGLIVYGAPDEAAPPEETFIKLSRLRYDLLPAGEREAVQKREGNELVIAPRATVLVPFEVALPDLPLEGQALGGIVVTKAVSEDDGVRDVRFDIQSLYSYAVAVQVQTDDQIEAAPQFSAVSASLISVAGWDALQVILRNEAPLVAAGAQLALLVLDDEANEVFAHTAERVSFAPKSEMPYTVFFGENMLPPGTYQVKAALTYEGTVWNMALPLDIPQAR